MKSLQGTPENKRKTVLEEVSCDTSRLYGSLDTAIAYLQEIKAKHPEATLDEHWTGYEDMYMRFVWSRPETDEELTERLEEEQRAMARAAEQRERDRQKEERRKQWERLRGEFGR